MCAKKHTNCGTKRRKKKKVRLRWFRYRWWWWTTSFDRICLTVFFLSFFFLLRCSYNLFALFSHAQVHHILLIESFFFFQQIGEEECGRGSRNQWFSQWAHTYRKRQRATPPSTLSSVAKSQGDRCGVESKKKKRKTGGCFFFPYRLRVAGVSRLRSRFLTFGVGRATTATDTSSTTSGVVIISAAAAFIAFTIATRFFGFGVEILLLQCKRLLHLLFAQSWSDSLIVHKSILMILGVDFDSPPQSIHGRLTFRRQHLRHYSARNQ